MIKNFNTSHVTVYRVNAKLKQREFAFQYISCYCLSVQTEIMQMQNTNFNTSHVTVYHGGWFDDPRQN